MNIYRLGQSSSSRYGLIILFLVPGNHGYARKRNLAKSNRLTCFKRCLTGSVEASDYPIVLSCGSSTAGDTPVGWLLRSEGGQVTVESLPW